jgi:uncharacterized protein (DUF58 family)
LNEILQVIANAEPRPTENTARAFQQASELCKHRGIVVVLSDLFDDLPSLMRGVDQMRFHRHEVVVFHLWDPWERDLPLEGHCGFHDLENGEVLITQAESIRDGYLRRVAAWRDEVESECRNRAVDRVELLTDAPLDQALLDYLVRRTKFT